MWSLSIIAHLYRKEFRQSVKYLIKIMKFGALRILWITRYTGQVVRTHVPL